MIDDDLEKLEKLDTDSATIFGMWFGIGGFFIGILGIAITIYTLNNSSPNIWVLTLSGWCAGLVATLALIYVASKQLKIIVKQNNALLRYRSDLITIKLENARLIEIDSYVISKAIKATARKSNATQQKDTSQTANYASPKED